MDREERIVPPEGNPANPAGEAGRAMLARMNAGAHEKLAEWGLAHVSFAAGMEALDIGCGGGANLARLLARMPQGRAHGIDVSPLSVEVSSRFNAQAIEEGRCTVGLGDASSLAFGDGSFDVITAFETVYFWPDMPSALREVVRVLKPGGVFLVCNEANGSRAADYELAAAIEGMTMYTALDLRALMEEAGLAVELVDDEQDTGRVCVLARRR